MFLFITPLFTSYPIQTIAASSGNPEVNMKDSIKSYNLIRSALLKNEPTGKFDTSEVSYKQVGSLIQKVVHENPEILYFDSAMTWSNGKIDFSYTAPISTINKNKAALTKEVDKLLAKIIKPGFTDFDKVKAVHDYLVKTVAYDQKNYQKNTIPADSYTAYGALIKKVAICDGYTKATQLLLNRLGIENFYVDGYGNGGPHAWNLIKLKNQYYFMDSTWDDPVSDVKGAVGYKYFLISSDQLRKDHSWNEKDWPIAKGKEYSFFNDFSSMIESKNHYFYSSFSDNEKLYRINKDGKSKLKVNNVRAPYFVIAGEWIYFSNYSNGGFLYKMKTDGSNLKQLNSTSSVSLAVVGKQLHYTDSKTKKVQKLTIQ